MSGLMFDIVRELSSDQLIGCFLLCPYIPGRFKPTPNKAQSAAQLIVLSNFFPLQCRGWGA